MQATSSWYFPRTAVYLAQYDVFTAVGAGHNGAGFIRWLNSRS
jgi:hypothetical protein